MFKSFDDQVAILGVCVDEPQMVGRTEGLNYCAVRSARKAIDMMRMLSFDLVLVGTHIPDMNTWDLLRRMKTGFAQQKWALVGGLMTDQQEITARMFGSLKIYDITPSSDELIQLTSSLREKAALAVLNRNYTAKKPAAYVPAPSAAAF
jgi:CheY-like chemotaxis protein